MNELNKLTFKTTQKVETSVILRFANAVRLSDLFAIIF